MFWSQVAFAGGETAEYNVYGLLVAVQALE
jgi:hypothetical protein